MPSFTSSTTRLERLKTFLSKPGTKITGTEAQTKFGISNLARAAQTLQNQGVAVYRNYAKRDGHRVAEYHISSAAPNIVRAGFVAYRLAKKNPVVAAAIEAATRNAQSTKRNTR